MWLPMLASLKKLYALLTPRDRRHGALLAGMMLVGACLEVVGVAAIPAFVSAILDPDRVSRMPVVGGAFAGLGLEGTTELVVWGAIALMVIFAVKNGFLILNHYLQLRYVTNRRIQLAGRLTRAYMNARYAFHLSRNTSELLRNVDREVTVVTNSVMGAILDLCTRVLIMAAVLLLLFLVEPWITLYWITFFGSIAAIGVVATSAKLRRFGLAEQRERARFVQALYQGFGSFKEARVLNREHYFIGKIDEAVRHIAVANRFKQFIWKIITPIAEFTAVTGLLVLVAGLILIGRPMESVLVTLSLFAVGMVRLRETISATMSHFAHLRYELVSVDPVHDDLMALESSAPEARAHRTRPAGRHLQQEIELRDVWYRYDGAPKHAVQGVSLRIPAGSAVGFVGSTGAGKSTLVDIILGLLEPERGGILVDGVDIRAGGVGRWQTAIGYVPQSIYLLDDTIRRNVALGVEDRDIDADALRAALRAAQLEGFVERQPQGLDTVVGERGMRLSGGERQRIGIARALYHNPDVLVLDEATSSLDNATERAVIQAVEALKGQRTIIMIAHRLTTVRACDTLHFLKDGRIEATGGYAELQAGHDGFREMAAL